MQHQVASRPPDDEHPDVHEEARIHAPNERLGGRTPEQAIDAGQEPLVRDILRSIKHIGVS